MSSPSKDIIVDVEKSLESEPSLQFRDYSAAKAPIKANNTFPASSNNHVYSSEPEPPKESNPAAQPAKNSFWNIDYYACYFNVDSTDVMKRMLLSVLPKDNLLELTVGNPDMYGPFWIATTVIFLVFIINTISKAIQLRNSSTSFEYDFTKLTGSATTLYVFISGVPLLVWGLMRYFGFAFKLVDVMFLYGYSLTIWIPITILSLLPSTSVHIILGLVALAVTVVFSIRNFSSVFGDTRSELFAMTRGKRISGGTVIFFIVFATQAALACMFIFWFFVVDISSESGSSTQPASKINTASSPSTTSTIASPTISKI